MAEHGWNDGDVVEYKGDRYTVSNVRIRLRSEYAVGYATRTLTPEVLNEKDRSDPSGGEHRDRINIRGSVGAVNDDASASAL